MRWPSRVLPLLIAGFSVTALAQGPTYKFGRAPTDNEIRAWDIAISPDGKELPPGSGTAKQGASIYISRGCVECHGPTGSEGPGPRLVNEDRMIEMAGGSINTWPFAPSIWDYINRAMPYDRPLSLSGNEVYALTAYLLHLNGITGEDDVMDATTLPRVQMPRRSDFTPPPPEWKPGTPRPCMSHCK